MRAIVIVAAAILAGSILGAAFLVAQQGKVQSRFTFTVKDTQWQSQTITLIYRLDTVTGELDVCSFERLTTLGTIGAKPDQPAWCADEYRPKNP